MSPRAILRRGSGGARRATSHLHAGQFDDRGCCEQRIGVDRQSVRARARVRCRSISVSRQRRVIDLANRCSQVDDNGERLVQHLRLERCGRRRQLVGANEQIVVAELAQLDDPSDARAQRP